MLHETFMGDTIKNQSDTTQHYLPLSLTTKFWIFFVFVRLGVPMHHGRPHRTGQNRMQGPHGNSYIHAA